MKVAQDTQHKTNQMLKDWGCDAKCIDNCTASPENFANSKGCTETCDCPLPFDIRQTHGSETNYYQHQFEAPAYNLYGYHGYHGSHGYQHHTVVHHEFHHHVPTHYYHYS